MNRQVPQKMMRTYTVVGNGKVAKHFLYYFKLLGIGVNHWHRHMPLSALHQFVQSSDSLLLLIRDDAIEAFIREHPFIQATTLVHFSGSLSSDMALACHPLMTFSSELYDLQHYQAFPFVCENGVDFKSVFPQLKNPSYCIDKSQKAFYHAQCVMAGNFSQILMRSCCKQVSQKLGLPEDVMFPYLQQNTQNFIANPDGSSTGPLQRGDLTTVNKNLQALENNDLAGLYRAFITYSHLQKQSKTSPTTTEVTTETQP